MIYYIKQKVFSVKDKFDVYDQNQELEYQFRGKLMSLSNKLELLDTSGEVILSAHKKLISFMPKYFVYDLFNDEVAVIKKLLAIPAKFSITALDKEYHVSGSLFAHSFTVSDSTGVVASIEKKLISWGDTYEIDIADEENAELFLFLVIVIDQIMHEGRR